MKKLVIRTLSGLAFLVIMIGGILWCQYSFAVIMLAIIIGSMVEFMKLTSGTSYKFARGLTVLAGAILFLLSFTYVAFDLPGSLIMLSVFPVAIVMIASLYVKDKTEYSKFTNMYAAILYIAVPMAMTNLAVFGADGRYTGFPLLCFFILTWVMDTCSFIFGMLLGQRYGKKLAPTISPKKSWIGFWGGLACTLGASVLLAHWGLLDLKWWAALILGAAMAVAGVYGDLIESQWKRYYMVKDSGNTIPGHGGMLDRFDAALFTLPVGVIFMEIVQLF